jgi:putative transposase
MEGLESLSHTNWECKYHVVFIPKRRRKTLYGELRRHLGEVFRKERDPLGPGLRRTEAKLRRSALLGQRLLRLNRGAGQQAIREYIKNQEQEDVRLEQMNLWR